MWESRDPVLRFWEPPYMSLTVEARNFKFGTDTDGGEFQWIKCKIWSKGIMRGSRDPVSEFWDPPLISRERLKLETSNLARRRMAVCSNEENAKLGQKASCGGHVTHFWNFGISFYLANGWSYKLQIWYGDGRRWLLTRKMKNWVKSGHVGVTWPNFFNFGTPLISREQLNLQTSNLTRRRTAVSSNKKTQN